MKSLVLTAPFEFELQDTPAPTPGPNEVLIRVRAVGICGSDVHGMTGTTGRRIPPIVMGHEATGDVVEVGSGGDNAWVGRRVTFDSTIYCGRCDFCKKGQINLCDNRKVLGVSCDEYRLDGAFADYVVVPDHILYELPDSVSYEHGSLTEPLSVALHAVRLAQLKGQERVLVVGCGIIGLLAIQAARATGCGTIIATDLNPHRLEAARACGADVAVHPDALDDEPEVNVAFEAVGTGATVKAAIGKVRKGGTVVLIGNLAPEVPFPMQTVVARQIAVLGSCASSGEYPDCLDLIADGAIDATLLISEIIPLSQAATMFEKLRKNPDDHLKIVVKPGERNV
ncbi:MAG: galactitol-1-phosphate 5-dehydrogenase [Spirochaetales bacterium]|nr:galactitol-1-phosphate 5-dehydrogenase [Spirochaetales bacterium]